MRILHIGKFYAPQRGGIERHVQDLAEWFATHGNRVGVLVHQPGGHWLSTVEDMAGVRVRRVGCLGNLLYAPISPGFPWQLGKALSEIEPDVLHLHLPGPSCFAALASARARRIPWVVHWHADVAPDMPDWRVRAAYRGYRPFEQALLRRADTIIATSSAYVAASSALRPWQAKVRVIPLGIGPSVNTEAPAPAWPKSDGLRVLSVGRLSHYKGHAVLLRALAKVPDASLILIGHGEENARLQALVRELDLGDRVHMAGEVNDAELAAAYRGADVFALPSLDRSEAFGVVALEAMRAGLPVIASAIPGSGLGEVVEDGKTGMLVPPGDVNALVAAIERMRDSNSRNTYGSAGKVRWESSFSLDASARQVQTVYQAMLARPPTSARRSG